MCYYILSMDGGGIRGVLTARLLQRIVEERSDFLSKVNLFAGTSTGALLAVGLAKGILPSKLVEIYQQNGSKIFDNNVVHEVGSLGGLISAKYGTQQRYDGIHEAVGDATLDELLPKHVLVASFELDSLNAAAPDRTPPRRWKAKFFHNYKGSQSDGHQKAMDVVMRSSAAPTYFPIYEGFIDGGVVANNPSMCALAQAIEPNTGGQDIKNVVLLSIGTGTKPQFMPERDSNWGIAEWNFKLLDLLFDSGSGLADYQCRQLLGSRYTRLNVNLQENIGLDAASKVGELVRLADACDLNSTLGWINDHWN